MVIGHVGLPGTARTYDLETRSPLWTDENFPHTDAQLGAGSFSGATDCTGSETVPYPLPPADRSPCLRRT